jgi:tetratricopeptide (TPR) repeat protein
MIAVWLARVAAFATAAPEPPSTVAAPPSLDLAQEADLQYQLGLRAYQARDLDQALEHLLASNRLVPNDNVVFNLGRVHEARGDLPSAWRYYDQYVRIEDDPERRREGEEARARIQPSVARVRVASEPPGARVYLERVELGSRGTTPVTLALPPGVHQLLVADDGAVPVARSIEVSAGELTEVSVPVPTTPLPSASGGGWLGATVSAGELRLVTIDDVRCTLLGDIGAGYRALPPPEPELARGSAIAAALPADGLVVDLRGAGRPPVRAPLEPVSRKELALRDAVPLWPVFERCLPETPARIAVALEALPKAQRLDAVRLFAEWAAWRGAPDAPAAAEACLRGDCTPLATGLTGADRP